MEPTNVDRSRYKSVATMRDCPAVAGSEQRNEGAHDLVRLWTARAERDGAVRAGRDVTAAAVALWQRLQETGSLRHHRDVLAVLARFHDVRSRGVDADPVDAQASLGARTAVGIGDDAAGPSPENRVESAEVIDAAAVKLVRRYLHSGDLPCLEASIALFGFAVDIGGPEHPHQLLHLSNFEGALRCRFERTGDRPDLDKAVAIAESAVRSCPADAPLRALLLSNLGAVMQTRFAVFGDPQDLDRAIAGARDSLLLPPTGRLDRPRVAANLSSALQARFEIRGDRRDLDEAVDFALVAADITSQDDPNHALHMSTRGVALRTRATLTGDQSDLDEAVEAFRAAAEEVPGTSPYRHVYLGNLASSLLSRYQWTGAIDDLERSIETGGEVLGAVTSPHPDRAMLLRTQGLAFSLRFRRSGAVNDLARAIDAYRQAVEASPTGHPDRPMRLSGLANTLLNGYRATGDRGHLDEATHCFELAIATSRQGDPRRAEHLSGLASALAERFACDGDERALELSIRLERQALDSQPEDHPSRSVHLRNLAISLWSRHERTGSSADLREAIERSRQAAAVPGAVPALRFLAAHAWGGWALRGGDPQTALAGYAEALRLLPLVASVGLDERTRRHQLAQVPGFASNMAAAAIAVGRPELAVEALEQGRSVLWTQALSLRSDFSRLEEEHPELAEQLRSIRHLLLGASGTDVLDPAAGSDGGGTSDIRLADARRTAGRRWDALLAEIRELDGFESFLGPTPFAELRRVAVDGPVVILNVSRHGCHALIVTEAQGVRVLDLPALEHEDALQHARRLLAVTRPSHLGPGEAVEAAPKPASAVLDTLAWLWDTTVRPVLDVLEPGVRRVWWSPTGPLAFLPIHAAGRYVDSDGNSLAGRNAPDRVISSYASTLGALGRARRRRDNSHGDRQLAVGVPEVAGLPILFGVTEEIAALSRHFPVERGSLQLVGAEATRPAVLAALADGYDWLHLACHAGQNASDPAQSAFEVQDGPLTISDLMAAAGGQGRLAYASACETHAGAAGLPDEHLHLAAALQFAGYQHAVAALWFVGDAAALVVAEATYAGLAGSGPPDATRTAAALHDAVGQVRRHHLANPLAWAAFVHSGP